MIFSQAEDAQGTSFWKQKIVGKQLYFGLTRGDGSEKRVIDLCSDGTFMYYGNSHIAFDEDYGYGSGNSNNNNSGTYSITTVGYDTFLSVSFTTGEVYEFVLSTNEVGNTFLDNSRYYVQDSERCR